VDHFGHDPDVPPDELRREARILLARARELGPADLLTGPPCWPEPETELQAAILATFRWAAGHPVITSLDDLEHWLPEHGWEIGRFPEYYIDRILHDYAAAGAPELPPPWRLGPAADRLLPGPPPVRPGRIRAEPAYAQRVLDKVRRQLATSRELFTDQRATRIATVKFWYLREAFRFGSQSRYSMLYSAWELEKLVEGISVSLTISRIRRDAPAERRAHTLLDGLTRLRAVHETHAERYARCAEAAGSDQYRAELAALRRLFDDDPRPDPRPTAARP
jgi:hypothetical protein